MNILMSLVIPPLVIYVFVVVASSFANLRLSAVDITEWSETGRLIYFVVSAIGWLICLAMSESGVNNK